MAENINKLKQISKYLLQAIIIIFSIIIFFVFNFVNFWMIYQLFSSFLNLINSIFSIDNTILFLLIDLILFVCPFIFIYKYLKDTEKNPLNLIKIIAAFSCVLLILIIVNGVGAIVIQKNAATTFPFSQTNATHVEILTIWSFTNSQNSIDCVQNLTINNSINCVINNNTLKATDWLAIILAGLGIIAAFIILLDTIRKKAGYFFAFLDSDDDERNKNASYFVYSTFFVIVIALIILCFGSITLIKENWYEFAFLLIVTLIFVSSIYFSSRLKKFFLSGNSYTKIEDLNRAFDRDDENIKVYFEILEQLDFWTFIISGFALIVIIVLHFSILIFLILIIYLMFNYYCLSAILNIPYEKHAIFLKTGIIDPDFQDIYIMKKSKNSVTILTRKDEFVTIMNDTISHFKSMREK